ncbi:MAG TPA: carboxypeptidase-like regulatory domain-containing protein [Polyangiales bacterium]|nr:carboxypeptidase-like regulatory domain-containing protein [Polyangiales bacterium]
MQLTLEAADPDREPTPIATRNVRTDDSGRFVQALTRGGGRYNLLARYAGDTLHEPANTTETFDVTRAGVQLQIDAARVIALDEASSEVEVRARSEAGMELLRIALSDESGRKLAGGLTDVDGVWRATLPNATLGDHGAGQWIATSQEDAQHLPGRAVLPVLRQRATRLTLSATYDAKKRGVHVAGALDTRAGPLPRAPIGLFIDGEHQLTLLSDERGRFDRWIELEPEAEAVTRHFSARFDPDTPALRPSRAPEQAVIIPARPGPNLLWVLLPCLASLALSWFVLRRTGSWLGPRATAPSNAPGVQLGAARSRRGTNQSGLDGVIEDADTTARLAAAALRVTRSDGLSFVAQIARDGSFAIARLEPGVYRVEARAPGYAIEASSVRIPHAGEGSGLRVRLRSLRTLALDAHRPLLRQVFPAREQQHTATVRETLLRAPSVWPRVALEQLSTLVEQTAYAPNEPTAEQVQQIENGAGDLLGPPTTR